MFDGLKKLIKGDGSRADTYIDPDGEQSNDLFVWIIALVLLAFTAFRSIHLVSSTLPADAQMLGVAALAALDAGALGWLVFANSTNGPRHGLALLMVALDLFGVGAAVVADTALVAGANKALVETIALWAVPVIVVANVAATFAVKAMDPARKAREVQRQHEARIERERRRVQDEITQAEREAELMMLRNRAALMRQRSAALMLQHGLSNELTGRDGQNDLVNLNAEGENSAKRSKAAPKG